MSVRKGRSSEGEEEMLIAGLCSAECLDRDQEIAFQKGLDFRPFLGKTGAFNVDHDNSPANICGIGRSVTRFSKGDKLPDGSRAEYNSHWVEGVLIDTPRGREIYQTCKALAAHNRHLFLSIEGIVTKRMGERNHILAKAEVDRIAVTTRPVCEQTSLMTKTLATRLQRENRVIKAMDAMGADGKTPNVLMRQDLSRRITNLASRTASYSKRKKTPHSAQKSQAVRKALVSLYRAAPHLAVDTAIELAQEHVRNQSRKRTTSHANS